GHNRFKARKEKKTANTTGEQSTPNADQTPPTNSNEKSDGGPTVIVGTVISSETHDPPPANQPATGDLIPTVRNHMSECPRVAAAKQVTAAAASYKPQTMWIVDQDLEQVAQVPLAVAEAFKIYTMTLQNNYPIHPAIVEA